VGRQVPGDDEWVSPQLRGTESIVRGGINSRLSGEEEENRMSLPKP
jgi:hypothetical protein